MAPFVSFSISTLTPPFPRRCRATSPSSRVKNYSALVPRSYTVAPDSRRILLELSLMAWTCLGRRNPKTSCEVSCSAMILLLRLDSKSWRAGSFHCVHMHITTLRPHRQHVCRVILPGAWIRSLLDTLLFHPPFD